MNFYDKICESPGYSAVALGYFDGIHLGHRKVISKAVECKMDGLVPAVFTFSKSPAEEISGIKIPRLVTPQRKKELLASLGVQALYCVSFGDYKSLSAEEFIEYVMHRMLKAKKLFCGFNYHFGRGGTSDACDLKRICGRFGIEAVAIDPVTDDGDTVSSTRIRKLISEGDITAANRMLGRPYEVSGEVQKGRGLGTKLGTPTLNQQIGDIAPPRFGVYLSEVTLGDTDYFAVTNIGVKPTVGSEIPVCETWIPDYSGDLYGQCITVRLLEFIRSERRFLSVEELQAAIKNDAKTAQEIYSRLYKAFR